MTVLDELNQMGISAEISSPGCLKLIGCGKSSPEAIAFAKDNKEQILFELGFQAPEPPAGCAPEYAALWNQAHGLADFIDNPHGAPLEERRARLPELNELRAEMTAIERASKGQKANPWTGPGWTLWKDPAPAERAFTTADCPARCGTSGKCYGTAFFDHKSGRAVDCVGDACPWIEQGGRR